jgi:hypothetical protein
MARRNIRTREKQKTASNRTYDALCEEELVVLRRKGCHHEPEDVEEGTEEDGEARAVGIGEGAGEGTLGLC